MALAQFSMSWASSLCGAATNFFHSTTHRPPQITIIEDVQIWDGEKYLDDTSITIVGQIISLIGGKVRPRKAKLIQGNGGFLMPGLIDAHIHAATVMIPADFQPKSQDHLQELVEAGVTTGFDMGSFPSSEMPQFHDLGEEGLPSLLWSGAAACGPEGFPAIIPNFPNESIVISDENATNFAKTRIREGADYLKIFINEEGKPKQEYQETIKKIADQHHKMIVTHAPDFPSQETARKVGGRFITHVPKEQALTHAEAKQMLDNNQIAIPTLIMSQNLIHMGPILHPNNTWNYSYSNNSVAAMYEVGVPILVGTDASGPVGFVGYGKTIHTEMSLLHDAGMSTVDILRGATSLPAKYFNLPNRGKIAPGKRADLLLLRQNPLDNIENSNTVEQVWTAGTQAYPSE